MSAAIGQIGVFSVPLEVVPRQTAVDFVGELASLGYGAVWTGEGLGTREIFANAAVILGGTERIAFCAGIANIYARDPVTAVTATRTLLESFPGRFMLGLGVSHPEQVEPRGHAPCELGADHDRPRPGRLRARLLPALRGGRDPAYAGFRVGAGAA